MKATQQEINLLTNSLFAKSRTNQEKYINADTGVFFDINQYTEFMAFNMNEYSNTTQEKVQMIVESTKHLLFLNSHVAEKVENVKPIWAFLKSFFRDKSGVEVTVSEIRTAYVNEFGNASDSTIMINFGIWATEMNYAKTVKKRRFGLTTFIVVL
jgi:hypothetical protein